MADCQDKMDRECYNQILKSIDRLASKSEISLRTIYSSDACELSLKSSRWLTYKDYNNHPQGRSLYTESNKLALQTRRHVLRVLGPTLDDFADVNKEIKTQVFSIKKIYENIKLKREPVYEEIKQRSISISCYLLRKISNTLNQCLSEDYQNKDYYFTVDSDTFRLDNDKCSSFHEFPKEGMQKVAKFVIVAGIQLESFLEKFFSDKESMLRFPIYKIYPKNNKKIETSISTLLEQGADVNVQNKKENTPS